MLDGLLLRLPDDVLRVLATDWMPLASFLRLDAAVCNRALRHDLEAFISGRISISPVKLCHGNALLEIRALQWVLKRAAAVSDFPAHFEILSNYNFRRKLLKCAGERTAFVKFEDNYDEAGMGLKRLVQYYGGGIDSFWSAAFSDICNYCPHLTAIQCNREFDLCTYERIGIAWPHLQEIRLGELANDDTMAALAQHCHNLQIVMANNSRHVTVSGLEAYILYRGNTLQRLHADVGDSYIDHLCMCVGRHCPQLNTFQVGGRIEHLHSLKTLLHGCPRLQQLHVSCHHLGNAAVLALNAIRAPLRGLRIYGAEFMAEKVLINYLQRTCRLQIVTIEQSHKLTDNTAVAIAQCHPGLQQLHLDIGDFTDYGLLRLAAYCPKLQRLTILRAEVTDEGLTEAMSHWPHLTELSVPTCVCVTDALLVVLPQLCPGLVLLNVTGCMHVTMKGVRKVIRKCPKLKHIYVCAELQEDTSEEMVAKELGKGWYHW